MLLDRRLAGPEIPNLICGRDTILEQATLYRKALLDSVTCDATVPPMIVSFRSKALKAFWEKGDTSKIRHDLVDRLRRRLDALNDAIVPEDMNVPGFDFHKLRGAPVRYSVHVNGPWCLTFGWEGQDAIAVNLENYH